MMKHPEMAYFDITGPDQIAEWDAYRAAYIAHREAARDLCNEIGAVRFWLGFSGGICKAEFKSRDSRHPAFSAKFERRGGHVLIHHGKTDAQREAIAFMKERNAALEKMRPDPNSIADRHGFITYINYYEPGQNGAHVVRAIGNIWERTQPLWAGMSSPITLYTSDAAAAILNEAERGNVTFPPTWDVPEGYVRILKEEWELRLATYKLERAKAGEAERGDDE